MKLTFNYFVIPFLICAGTLNLKAQESLDEKRFELAGMYLQWGYNLEWYTKSDLHFKMANGDKFTIHDAKAKQRPDFDAIYKYPFEISVPQYNYRMGFYINKKKTMAIEVNFDHMKYVVVDGQTARVSGILDGKEIDEDMILDPETFLHIEHTDGVNLFHFNFVKHDKLLFSEIKNRNLLTYVWKAGAGFNVPRTDFTFRGDRLNNKFHLAGFNIGAEGGIRYYPAKTFFFEFAAKVGYVNYLNVLADTETTKGNRANHDFGYVEMVLTMGGDINFNKKRKK